MSEPGDHGTAAGATDGTTAPEAAAPEVVGANSAAPPKPGLFRRLDRRAPELLLTLAWLVVGFAALRWQPLGTEDQLPSVPTLLLGLACEIIQSTWLPGAALMVLLAVWSLFRGRFLVALLYLPLLAYAVLPAVLLGGPKKLEGPELRIGTVNLLAGNEKDPWMDEAIRELNADILVFPEFTPLWRDRLMQAFGEDYPHRVEDPLMNPFGIALWSRLPLGEQRAIRRFGSFRPQVRVEVQWEGHRFALFGIHPNKPFPHWSYPLAVNDRKELLDWLGEEELPVIVAGDFNATPRSPWMDRLESLGLVSIYQHTAGSLTTSWPAHRWWSPVFGITIDHVFCSQEFVPGSYRTGQRTMSDHAPVVTTLGWADGE